MSPLKQRVQRAVTALAEALRALAEADPALGRLPLKPGRPATAARLAAFERRLGQPLPPSVRAFYELHDGYRGLALHGDVVSLADASPGGRTALRVARLARKAGRDDETPWTTLVPLADSAASSDFVYLDLGARSRGSERSVVRWEHDDDPVRFPSLLAYLGALTRDCREFIRTAPERLEADARRADAKAGDMAARAAAAARPLAPLRRASRRQGEWTASALLKPTPTALRCAALAPDGRTVAAADEAEGGTVWVWTVEGAPVRKLSVLEGRGRVSSLAWAGEALLVAGRSRLEVLDVGEGRAVANLERDEDTPILVSPSGDAVIAVRTGALVRFEAKGWRRGPKARAPKQPGSLAWCRGGAMLAVLEFGGDTLHLLRADTLAPAGTVSLPEPTFALASSADGRVLAAAAGPVLTAWDEALAPVARVDTGGKWVQFLAVSPDRRVLVSSASGAVRVWRLADGAKVAQLKGSSSNSVVSFTPDGRTLFEAGSELRLWSVPEPRSGRSHRDAS